MMKKGILWIMAGLFLLILGGCGAKQEGMVLDAYDRMIASFSQNKLTNGSDYPDYYGGAYIDEAGDLVVNVTDNSAQVLSELKAISGLSELKIRLVPYSYAQLVTFSEKLKEYVNHAKADIADKICGYGIDQEKCLVRVYMENRSKDDEETIRAIVADLSEIDPQAIVFMDADGQITED